MGHLLPAILKYIILINEVVTLSMPLPKKCTLWDIKYLTKSNLQESPDAFENMEDLHAKDPN